MGKKVSWISAVKKALSPDTHEKKDKKSRKSKRKWFRKRKSLDLDNSPADATLGIHNPTVEELKLAEAENEQSKHAYSVAFATAMAAEAAVAAAQAAAEVVRLTSVARYAGKSREEVAAIKIQTAFRGYLARRALRALRGLVRLKSLIQGQSCKRQATSTLRCMQTLARVQSQIRARRIRMTDENEALQKQMQQKHEKELEKELEKLRVSIGEDWDASGQSKEKMEAKLQSKQEAAMRRERALAYAYSHQKMWKNTSKSGNPTFMDPNNPHWGWSWLERWMAARPWESGTAVEKELNSDRVSVKSATSQANSVGLNNRPSPKVQKPGLSSSRQSPSTPTSKGPTSTTLAKKSKTESPRWSACGGTDEDSRSMHSAYSDRHRRHSIAGSSVRDDESLGSSASVPSYMAPTASTKARSKLPSPLGLEKNESPDKSSTNAAKKRLSFGSSPAGPRRHSGPPKVDTSLITDISVHSKEKVSNGGGR